MATPPRTARPPKAEAAGVSAARIRLGRVFRVESKDYFLLLGTTLFLVVFGLVMVLSSSSVESNLEDGGFFVQAREQLGSGVVAVVQQRLMQSLKRRARIDRGVLEADLLDDVHHEVGGRASLRGDACRRGTARLRRHRVRKIVGERRQFDRRRRLDRRCGS